MNSVTAFSNDTLSERIESELLDIRPGSPAALLHVRLFDAAGEKVAADSSLLEKLEAELPVKMCLDNRNTDGVLVWLPRTHRDAALTMARLIRTLVVQQPLQITEADKLVSARHGCAIGLVTVAQNNWQADALIATAEVTSAMAALKKANSICSADQVAR